MYTADNHTMVSFFKLEVPPDFIELEGILKIAYFQLPPHV